MKLKRPRFTGNKTSKFSKMRIIKNLTVISLTFVLLFTSYNGLSMLQTTMNKKEGIGTISQAVIYTSYGLSSLTLPTFIIKKFGTKTTLFMSVILYLPYIAANFYPSWITMMPSAVLVGIGTTLIWASQSTYFNESCAMYCALEEDARLKKFEDNKKFDLNSSNCEITVELRFDNERMQELSIHKLEHNTDNREGQLQNAYSGNYKCDTKELAAEQTIPDSENSSVKHSQEAFQMDFKRITETNTNEYSNTLKETKIAEIDLKPLETLADFSTERERAIFSDKISTHHVSDNQFRHSNHSFASANALFFGWHGLAYYSAQVSSNLISFYILRRDNNEISNRIYNCTCGFDYCNSQVECFSNETEEITEGTRYLLTAVCIAFAVIAAMLIFLLLDPLEKSKEPVKFSWHHIIATIKYSKKKEQILLIPLTIFVSMCQGIYTADFTKAYVSCAWSTSQIGLVTVFYGITSALTSMLSGFIIKYSGRIPVFLLGQLFNTINFVFLLLWRPEAEQSFMFFLAGGLWGAFIGIYLSQLRAFYGVLFQGDEETAFGSCSLYSAIGWSLPFIYNDFLCTSVKLYILFSISCIGILGYLFTERIYYLENKTIASNRSKYRD
ncbi:UNC93-like protein [Nephila pilipes]|uniref:UNC93-like protein n=1 Tax=Nephila pilipes TaxID=299642 RepID=A0A8X6M613_NEPPI|nr:UNC93-like protein [Nephila pilipes]